MIGVEIVQNIQTIYIKLGPSDWLKWSSFFSLFSDYDMY